MGGLGRQQVGARPGLAGWLFLFSSSHKMSSSSRSELKAEIEILHSSCNCLPSACVGVCVRQKKEGVSKRAVEATEAAV